MWPLPGGCGRRCPLRAPREMPLTPGALGRTRGPTVLHRPCPCPSSKEPQHRHSVSDPRPSLRALSTGRLQHRDVPVSTYGVQTTSPCHSRRALPLSGVSAVGGAPCHPSDSPHRQVKQTLLNSDHPARGSSHTSPGVLPAAAVRKPGIAAATPTRPAPLFSLFGEENPHLCHDLVFQPHAGPAPPRELFRPAL